MKKFISLLLVAAMCLSLISTTAFATNTAGVEEITNSTFASTKLDHNKTDLDIAQLGDNAFVVKIPASLVTESETAPWYAFDITSDKTTELSATLYCVCTFSDQDLGTMLTYLAQNNSPEYANIAFSSSKTGIVHSGLGGGTLKGHSGKPVDYQDHDFYIIFVLDDASKLTEDTTVTVTGMTEKWDAVEEQPEDDACIVDYDGDGEWRIATGRTEAFTFSHKFEAPKAPVAKIGEDEYTSLAAAIAAVPTNGNETTITMIADVDYGDVCDSSATAAVYVNEIASGKNVVLDLNGHTIQAKRTGSKSTAIFHVSNGGALTINDSTEAKQGMIKLFAGVVTDPWAVSSSPIISNGSVTVNAGTIISGEQSGSYAVDMNQNGFINVAPTFTMNGGKLDSTYVGLRLFANGGNEITATINNGEISGQKKGLWVHQGSATGSTKNATVTINDGVITSALGNAVEDWWQATNDAQINITIKNGKFSAASDKKCVAMDDTKENIVIKGGLFNQDLSLDEKEVTYVAPGYACVANDDNATKADYPWKVQAIGIAKIGDTVYTDMQSAFNACPENGAETTITLLCDVGFGKGFGFADNSTGKNIVLDLNGYTYTFVDPAVGSAGTERQAMHLGGTNKLTVKNGRLKVSNQSTTIMRLIQNYCDLTLDDVVLDTSNVSDAFKNYSNYDNSFCRGTVTLKGDTQFLASKDGVISFDIDGQYSGGGNVALIIDQHFTGSIGGAVEFTQGHSSLEDQANYFTAQISKTKNNVEYRYLYHSLADAIEAVRADETITMIADETNAKGISVASGKNFTVDFANHTYTINHPGAGSTGTSTQGFQLLKHSTITFKNGTIDIAEENKTYTWTDDPRGIAWLINNYANLTLEDMTIDGTNVAKNLKPNGLSDPGIIRYVINNYTGSLKMNGGSVIAADGDVAVSANWYGAMEDDANAYTAKPAVTLTGTAVTGKVEAISGTVDLESGTVVNGQVRVGENGRHTDKATAGATGSAVTIEKGATVTKDEYPVVVFGNNTLNVYGKVTSTSTSSNDTAAISTNGNKYNAGSVINIYDGAEISSVKCSGIYLPNGTLNISGGTITGETAVYMKSTGLNISGGTLIGNGADAQYSYNGNGGNPTGDALVIDSCNYPSGLESGAVKISGGTFISEKENTVAVAAIGQNGGTAVTKFITGGSFSSDPAKNGNTDSNYLAEGYGSSKTAASKYWVVGLKQETKEDTATGNISIKVDNADTNVTSETETTGTGADNIAAKIVEEVKANTAVTSFAATNAQNIPANNAKLIEGLKAAVNESDSEATNSMKAVINGINITENGGIEATMISGEATVTADLSKTVTVELESIQTETTVSETTTRTVNTVTYDVKPVVTVKLTEGETTKEYKVELSGKIEVPLTFRMTVPSDFGNAQQVEVFHTDANNVTKSLGFYTVLTENNKKFVEVTNDEFSYYTLGGITDEQKAQCVVQNATKYYTLAELQTAVDETIAADDTLVLLKDIVGGQFNITVPEGKTLTIDLAGKTCNVYKTGTGLVVLKGQDVDDVHVVVTDDKTENVYANDTVTVTFAIDKDFYGADVEFTFNPELTLNTAATGWEQNGNTYRYHNTSGEKTEASAGNPATIGTFTFTAKAQHNDNTVIDLVTVTKSNVALSMEEANTLDAINREVSDTAYVTVAKKQITLPAAESTTYNGKPQTSTFAADGEEGCTVGETVLTAGIVSVANVTKQDVGDYPVTFSIATTQLDFYRWADKADNTVDNTQTFSITKDTNGNEWTHEPTVESSVYGAGVAVYPGQTKFGTVKVEYSADNGASWGETMPTAVGSYIAKFSVAGTANYDPAPEKKINFTIAQAGISYTKPVAATNLMYTGSEQSLLATDGGITVTAPTDYIVTYTLNGEEKAVGDLKATDPGTYEVGWTITAGEGYATVSGSMPVTIMEAQFNSSLAPTGLEKQYTGAPQALADAPSGLDGATIQYKLGASGSWSDAIPTATEIGSYTVYYKITKTGYTSKEYYVVGKITPATMTADVIGTAPAAIDDLTYNGTEQALVTAGTLKSPAPTGANLCILYCIDDGDWTSDLPTAIGDAKVAKTYTVKYKVVDMNGKYADSEVATVENVVINPIEYHVVITDYIRSAGTTGDQFQMVYVFTNSNDVSFEYKTSETETKKMYDITALGYQLGSKTEEATTTYALLQNGYTEVSDMSKVYAVLVEGSATVASVTPANKQINGIAGTVSQPVGKENVNGTDNIDVYDAITAQGTYNNDETTMNYMQNVLRADVTKDGKVDSDDFAAIKTVYAPVNGN